ncbi:Beta-lactamase [Streptomyces sp. Termitarium-T10T-6]|nr:Beta-lactamase [Streptomyces sp. Termitarium-T10T-6]
MAELSRIPLLHQPGDGWLYNTCSDILGVLVARVADRPLPAYLAERIFEPLGMKDTGFWVEPAALGRFTSSYRAAAGGDGGEGESRGGAGVRAGVRAVAGPSPSWSTPRAGSGAARPRSRPAPGAWSRPSTTGTPSAGCCSPRV